MRYSILSVVLAAITLASAHEGGSHLEVARHLRERQQANGASTTATAVASSTSAGTVTTTTAAASITFTLESVNPTAVPLASIVSNAVSQATVALYSTAAAGATPTWATNAPPLPSLSSIVVSNYPALDKPPPTDSPEVQAWIQEVANSGVSIPDFTPTVAGGCPANPGAIANDTERCWWTCGGCTRDTDITTCPDKMTWGLTYDDGPAFYTPNLLQYLDEQNLKSTFFVVGSRALSSPATLQLEYMAGHQIGVHTWSHPSLTTLTNEEIIAELGWGKKIIKDVLGVTPNTMRPPYGDIDDRVRAISIAMGLTPVIWTRISPEATFDTGDFDVAGGTVTVQQVLNNWEDIIGNSSTIDTGFIVLEHDLYEQTVDIATGYILPDALAHNPSFTIQPVITCLNMPLTNAYIELNDNSTNPPPASLSSDTTASSGALGSTQTTKATGSSSPKASSSSSSSNNNNNNSHSSSSSSSSSDATLSVHGGGLLTGLMAIAGALVL